MIKYQDNIQTLLIKLRISKVSKLNLVQNVKNNLYIRYLYYFIQFFSGFFLIPFYLNNFSIKLFGVWLVISSISGFLLLMDPSSSNLIVQQISERIKKNGYRGLNKIILPSIFNSIIISILILIIGKYFLYPILINIIEPGFHNTEIDLIFRFAVINISLMVMVSTFTGFYEGLQKSQDFGPILIFGLIFKIVLVIFFIEKNYGIKSIVISDIIANLIVLAYLILLFIIKYKNYLFNNKLILSDYYIYSKKYIHNYGGRFSKIFISGGLDNLIISKFIGLDMVTIFNLAQKLPKHIESLVGLFFTSSRSSMTYLLTGKKSISNNKLIISLIEIIIFINFFFLFILFDVLNPFLKIWISEDIYLNEQLIFYIIFIMALRIYISSIQSIIFNKGNIKYVNNIQIFHSLILIPTIILCSSIYKFEGLLLSYLIVNLIIIAPACTIKIFKIIKNDKKNLFSKYKSLSKTILILGLSSIAYKYLFELISFKIDTWFNLILLCIIKIFIFSVLILLIKQEFRNYFFNKCLIFKNKIF